MSATEPTAAAQKRSARPRRLPDVPSQGGAAVTCRHEKGDPNCGAYSRAYASTPTTPDAEKYTIGEVEHVGGHLVMKVTYPNCRACSFEGTKVLVFLGVSPVQALRWRKIDPHFRESKTGVRPFEAPSPAARFPASAAGWADALAYARGKAVQP